MFEEKWVTAMLSLFFNANKKVHYQHIHNPWAQLQIFTALFVTDFTVWKPTDRSIAILPDPPSELFFRIYAKNELHQSLGW